jgi:nucleoside 2-deoxyribosyltransferase
MNTETNDTYGEENNTKVYLCGPINGCTDEEATNWREKVKTFFPYSIDPMKRDYRGVEKLLYREIVDLDKRDIRNSDIILVNYDKPSVGTSMEVFYAWTLGIPVVVWCSPDARLSPWLVYHSTSIIHSLETAVLKIKEIA